MVKDAIRIASALCLLLAVVSTTERAFADTPNRAVTPRALVELGVEYGRYFGELRYDETLRDETRVTRLSGPLAFEGEPTLGGKLLLGAGVVTSSRFWRIQGALGLALRRSPTFVLRPDTELGASRVAIVPYSTDVEIAGRVGILWGWAHLEGAIGAHTLFGTVRVEHDDLKAEAFDDDWGLAGRLGGGIGLPLFDPFLAALGRRSSVGGSGSPLVRSRLRDCLLGLGR